MTPGPLLFARYAYAPNALGYCGADEPRTLLEYGDAQASDSGLSELARTFDGAWPYLELIAGAAGIGDPVCGKRSTRPCTARIASGTQRKQPFGRDSPASSPHREAAIQSPRRKWTHAPAAPRRNSDSVYGALK